MTAPPLVGVLLPVRDGAATLGAALSSLARQTEPRWECVVVDDGSRDGSGALAREVAHHDARVRVVPATGVGLVAALETGRVRLRAPVVARMDADDLMRRDRLAIQLDALSARPSLAAVGSHVRLFPRRTLTRGMLAYERWLTSIRTPVDVRRERFVECPVVHPTLAIRRDVLDRYGWREVDWAEDYDLLLRMTAAGEDVAVVPRRLLHWREGPGRLQRTHPRYGLDRFTAAKAWFLANGFLADVERYVLWGHGDTGRALRHALIAQGRRVSHVLELHPGRLGNRIDGAPVVPPDSVRNLAPCKLIVSVAGLAARTKIRAALAGWGFCEGRDFVVAA